MANNNNKTIYIIIGIVDLVIAVPFVFLILMFLAGFLFYSGNAH